MKDAYARAAHLYQLCQEKCVRNERPDIHFIKGTQDFWFVRDTIEAEGAVGERYERYHAEENLLQPLFDPCKFVEKITPYYEEEIKPEKLPLENVWVQEEKIYFNLKKTVGEFVWDIQTETLEILRFPLHDPEEVTSPNGAYSLFIRDHNIVRRENKTGKETQLTKDGCENLDYGVRFLPTSDRFLNDTPMKRRPGIVFSPSGKYFITYRTDRRLLGDLHLVQSVTKDGTPRPNGVSYRYALPGDEHILESELYIGDLENGTMKKVMLGNSSVILFILAMFEADSDQVKWTSNTEEAYLVRYDRFFKTIQCIVIEAKTATAKIIHEETYKTFGFVEYYGSAGQEYYAEPSIHYLPETGELLWHSELDGWSSLYLYDIATGQQKMRYTQDGVTFRRLKYVDPVKREIYFTMAGADPEIDPYFQRLYKANLDTGAMELLTVAPQEHFIRIQPEGAYYIDTHSTVETLPVTEICDMEGNVLLEVAVADIEKIKELYLQPEPFEALARDGKTKIYGILIKPYDFDPSKKYPVIDYIYGGSQKINVPKSFDFNRTLGGLPYGGLEFYAHLGFVGIIVDGLATPLRSKGIHDMIYEKAEECCGITDHVCAIRQLAEKYAWIDQERVGIWGASGGGYATARALLEFPDFYKVGVSLCGNHDQAKYHAHWGERWMGAYTPEKYKNQANATLAKNLQGKLLLIHGDMDDNVHPSATMQLLSALMEENKDFDSLIYPNSAHGVSRFKYVMRRKWDYFVTHLLGETPPPQFDIQPKKTEKE